MSERLIVETHDRICTLTLNRPEKRNALSPLLLQELRDTLGRLREEDAVRCVIIRGAGREAFSAGFDISDIPIDEDPESADPPGAEHPIDVGMEAIIAFPYPVIAMITGLAFGAGCELAAACDIRIAADHARFSFPPAKLGIVYRWRGVLKLIDIVGMAAAKEMFFTGRIYDAFRAREMGLVYHVLPDDQITGYTVEMAREIANNAPLSLKALKTIFNHSHTVRLRPEEARELEALRDRALLSEDIREGRQAFLEKRKPVFRGC